LLALAVVGGGVAAGIILTRGGGAHTTYSNYGFSFEYPAGMEIAELGLWDPEPNQNSGRVVGYLEEEDRFEIVSVDWISYPITEAPTTWELEDILDEGFALMEADGATITWRGSFEYGAVSGHPIVYESFTGIIEDVTSDGVYGIWYCDQSQRLYELIVLRNDGAQDAFQRYLDSFVCH
jgi:hypothetical protein